MMMSHALDRDERTVAVENASYRWGYLFVSFAVLVSVAYRAFALKQTSWDLLALVVIGGLVTTAYQRNQRILTPRWTRLTLLGMGLAAAAAAVLALSVR